MRKAHWLGRFGRAAHVNRRSASRCGRDSGLGANHVRSFLHGHQSEAAALRRTASRSNPRPSSVTVSSTSLAGPVERDAEPPGVAMDDAIPDRFLRDAEKTDGDVGVRRRRSRCGRERTCTCCRFSTSTQCAFNAGARPSTRNVAGCRSCDNAESLRTCPEYPGRVFDNAFCVCDVLDVARRALEAADCQRHVDQPLADIVVQILGDGRAGRVLCVDQPPGELADPLVARSKRRLARQDHFLGAAPPASLRQQPRDQQQLRGDDERSCRRCSRRYVSQTVGA